MSILKDLILILTFITFLYFCIKYYVLKNEYKIMTENFTEVLLHDLKTPTLAQLRGVELLQKESFCKTNAEQKELLAQIEHSCKYTLDMISMMLQAYRIENGKKSLVLETFSLSELLMECFDEILPVAEEKQLELVYAGNNNTTLVEADRTDIKTVILHLLQNAVAYSDKNEKVIVSIDINSQRLKMEIKNRGAMLYNASRFSAIGDGIKLRLSKKIINSHHGTISTAREGSDTNRFMFTLPVRAWGLT